MLSFYKRLLSPQTLIKQELKAKIVKNEKIAEIYYNDNKNIIESQNMVLEAFELTKEKVEKPKAILEIIDQ